MKNTKKILSFVLAIIMIVCTVPMAFAEDNTYKAGDIIQFGSYPQSEVKDEALIAELNALAPEWEEWISYGYYSGNGSSYTMAQGDWMRFFDLSYNGEKYRAVRFEEYRPRYTYGKASNNLQDDNHYAVNNIYWFKYEALDWRVLDINTGLVMCETIVDSQPYSNTLYERDNAISNHKIFNDKSHLNYGSDYATSSIRHWLNYDFYDVAFSEEEQKVLVATVLDNRGYYSSRGETGYEEFDSAPTEDKVFLLSYCEVINADYGFNSDSKDRDNARVARVRTDYAKCQGLNTSKVGTKWLLRSPGMSASTSCIVSVDGSSDGCQLDLCTTGTGIRPAIKLSIIHKHNYVTEITTPATHVKEGVETYTCACGDSYTKTIEKNPEHSYNVDVIAPTCKTTGYTMYSCDCGDSFKAEVTGIIDHQDADNNLMCDMCALFLGEGMESSDPCSCNCHKTGFMGFIWKITRFFNKLFKTNRTCACGVAHY